VAQADYVVVSGLARGIDARAHQTTLQTGTIAVLAGGQDRLYPADHAALLGRILDHGAAISEMPMGWEPRGRDFPRRNRIVAGVTSGTVVIEAARRSGSLITARFAVELGREVFAVPGSPMDPRAEGANDLLREGATLCARVEDITSVLDAQRGGFRQHDLFSEAPRESSDAAGLWDELDFIVGPQAAPRAPVSPVDEWSEAQAFQPTDIAARVVALLGPSPVSVDELARAAEASARDVQGVLAELDLQGRIVRVGVNLVALR
jgi:DNA processing protein